MQKLCKCGIFCSLTFYKLKPSFVRLETTIFSFLWITLYVHCSLRLHDILHVCLCESVTNFEIYLILFGCGVRAPSSSGHKKLKVYVWCLLCITVRLCVTKQAHQALDPVNYPVCTLAIGSDSNPDNDLILKNLVPE